MHDLTDQLGAWSQSLADSVEPAELESVTTASRTADGRTSSRPWLAAAATLAVVGGGVAAVALTGGDGDSVDDVPPVDTVAPLVTDPPEVADPTTPIVVDEPDSEPEDDPWPVLDQRIARSVDTFAASAPVAVDIAGVPLTDIAVSPSGRFITANRGDQICVIDTTIGTASPDEGCVDVSGAVGNGSLAWSPDEATVAFNTDVFITQQDPDINVLDVASGQIDVPADDQIDEFEDGFTDVAPFFGADGTLYFFRLEPDAPLFAGSVFEVDGDVVRSTGLTLEGIPLGVRTDPVAGLASITVQQQDNSSTIFTIDPAAAAVRSEIPLPNPTEAPPIVVPGVFVDIADGRSLLNSATEGFTEGQRAIVLDLDLDLDLAGVAPVRQVPATRPGTGRAVSGVGLSPDGDRVVMIVEDVADASGHRLVVIPILPDGSIGEPSIVAEGEEFAPNDGDGTIRPLGLGANREIVWVGDTLTYALGPNKIVSLELASEV